jgi:SAM-dependent methyltransferase
MVASKTAIVQVSEQHYNFTSYVNLARWTSYWHQITETLAFAPKTVLVIGVGDNIVGKILASQGIKVYTFDFDAALHPDFVGNLTDIHQVLHGNQFDVVLCCQVLEHLPYENFEPVLQQLKLIAGHVIISLPYSAIKYKIEIKFPVIKQVKLPVYIHKFWRTITFQGEHYWEIGQGAYTKRKISNSIKRFFTIKKRFIAPYNQYHLFFILTKK